MDIPGSSLVIPPHTALHAVWRIPWTSQLHKRATQLPIPTPNLRHSRDSKLRSYIWQFQTQISPFPSVSGCSSGTTQPQVLEVAKGDI